MDYKSKLLLEDLSSRLPYGVIVSTPKGDGHLGTISLSIFGTEYGVNIKATERDKFNERDCHIKPYLRNMSSMTDEEKKAYTSLRAHALPSTIVSWLDMRHFDHRTDMSGKHLIEIGLALEAPDGMYKMSKFEPPTTQ